MNTTQSGGPLSRKQFTLRELFLLLTACAVIVNAFRLHPPSGFILSLVVLPAARTYALDRRGAFQAAASRPARNLDLVFSYVISLFVIIPAVVGLAALSALAIARLTKHFFGLAPAATNVPSSSPMRLPDMSGSTETIWTLALLIMLPIFFTGSLFLKNALFGPDKPG